MYWADFIIYKTYFFSQTYSSNEQRQERRGTSDGSSLVSLGPSFCGPRRGLVMGALPGPTASTERDYLPGLAQILLANYNPGAREAKKSFYIFRNH